MERLYRCLNEECMDGPFEFYAVPSRVLPKCPQCGLDDVIELAVIHFCPPSRRRGQGLGILACTGKGWHNKMVTGDPRIVNCAACKQTEAWKSLHEVVTCLS